MRFLDFSLVYTERVTYILLHTFFSALKQMNLHVPYKSGPLIAVDVKNNIDLHWRAHGVPLRTLKTAITNLHYISNEIDDLAGGPHTVIMFNLGPHFTTYPLEFYTHRVLRIRKAVLALLQRAPDTTVIIKTVNTGYKVSLYSIMCSHTRRSHCDFWVSLSL